MEEVKTIEVQNSEEKEFRWKTVSIDMFKRGVMEFIGPKEELLKVLSEKFDGYAEVIKKVKKEVVDKKAVSVMTKTIDTIKEVEDGKYEK